MTILVLVSLSAAKMVDLYVILEGRTPQELENSINNMKCKWVPVGGPFVVQGIWYQAIMCRNCLEVSNRKYRNHIKDN